MADNDWKKRLGVVYSTNPDFQYTQAAEEVVQTLPPERQRLIVTIDRRARAGVGGTAKDGEITIQGDLRDKVTALLQQMGYQAKRGN